MNDAVVVTGAQGYLGRHFVAEWLACEPRSRVIGLGRSERCDRTFSYRLPWGERELPAPLPDLLAEAARDPRYDYRPLDLLDTEGLERLLREARPRAVVHLAAGVAHHPPLVLARTNVVGTVSLLEALRGAEIEAPRLVLGSTGAVSGRPPRLPIAESDRPRPADPYGATKLAAESIGGVLAERLGIDAVQARIFNPVGAAQPANYFFSHLVHQVAAIDAGAGEPQLRFGSLDATRDFIDARDVARALVLLVESEQVAGTYNLGGGVEWALRKAIELALEVAALDCEVVIEAGRGRSSGIQRHFADVSRLRALGFRPRFELRDTIADALDYQRRLLAPAAARKGDR